MSLATTLLLIPAGALITVSAVRVVRHLDQIVNAHIAEHVHIALTDPEYGDPDFDAWATQAIDITRTIPQQPAPATARRADPSRR